jgi:hypothetical protein
MAGIFAELAVELGGAVCAHAKVAIAIQAMAVSSFPGCALVICMDRALGRARRTFSLKHPANFEHAVWCVGVFSDAEALSFCGMPGNDSRNLPERTSDSLGRSDT